MKHIKQQEDFDTITRYATGPDCYEWAKPAGISSLQVAVYVMAGGGLLGRLAAEQPADFYIDSRVSRLPYPKREIEQAVKVLATIAKARGMDPHHLPAMPDFHSCGIF